MEKVHLRFWRVEGRVDVANILGALENAEGQRGQEVAGCKQAGCRPQCESGVFLHELRHVLELRDFVRHKQALFLEHLENSAVLSTGVFGGQVDHRGEYGFPGLVLRVCVLDEGHWVPAMKKPLLVSAWRSCYWDTHYL